MSILKIIKPKTKPVPSSSSFYIWFYQDKEWAGKCLFSLPLVGCVFIDYIEVAEEFRGKNLGTHYWKLVENYLVNELGCKKIELEMQELSSKHQKLQKHYESWGFEAHGKEKFAYNGDVPVRRLTMIKKFH